MITNEDVSMTVLHDPCVPQGNPNFTGFFIAWYPYTTNFYFDTKIRVYQPVLNPV